MAALGGAPLMIPSVAVIRAEDGWLASQGYGP
jgi:hypothetical protein